MNKEEERINELEEKLHQSQAKAGKAQEAVDKAQSTLRTVKDMDAAESVITAAEQAFEEAEEELAHAEEDIERAEDELNEARAEETPDNMDDIDDYSEDGQPKKKGKAGLVIGIIAAVALIGAGGWYYYTNFIQGAKQNKEPAADSQPLEMPDLTYEVADVAQSILKNKGIDADILFVSSEKVPKGLVALQSVSAGQEIGDGIHKPGSRSHAHPGAQPPAYSYAKGQPQAPQDQDTRDSHTSACSDALPRWVRRLTLTAGSAVRGRKPRQCKCGNQGNI